MKIKDDFVKVNLEDGTLAVIPTNEACKDKNGMFKLNETASVIYDSLEQGLSVLQISQKLIKEYDTNLEQATNYVEMTISKMREFGMIEDE